MLLAVSENRIKSLAITCFSVATLAGCSSAQVNYTSLDIGRAYESLMTKQVAYNLKKTLQTQYGYGIPSFVKVTSISAGTQNQFNSSFSLPVSPSTQGVSTVTGVVPAYAKTLLTAGKSLTFAANDQYSIGYTLDPIFDPDELSRLTVLYRFVARKISQDEFEASFPINQAASNGAATPATASATTISVGGKPVVVTTTSTPQENTKTYYARKAYNTATGAYDRYVETTPDKTFIRQPLCILCDYGKKVSILTQKDGEEKPVAAHLLEKNLALGNEWYFLPGEPASENAIAVSSGDLGDLLVKGEKGMNSFYELVLFTEQASVQGTGSAASGGQSEGRKTLPTQRLSVPVAVGSTPPQ